MRVSVEITRRPEIADPEGTNIMGALTDLGHRDIESVRVDRIIHLDISGDDPDQVKLRVEEMCRQLLANPVLEDFRVEVGE
ncbi:MAG TPA: phosphoribosylformylglycinamidine synthase subunit PurS [Acidimicrobiia bacterium]|nr:phosphoribosylformylglycinamidine synthase subunit PurS [Acidimicrobiia bacterium]